MRILLVQPAPFEPGRLGLENSLWLSEPVALTSIAAMVPDHEVRILDLRIDPDITLNETLLEFRPNLVGVTLGLQAAAAGAPSEFGWQLSDGLAVTICP